MIKNQIKKLEEVYGQLSGSMEELNKEIMRLIENVREEKDSDRKKE